MLIDIAVLHQPLYFYAPCSPTLISLLRFSLLPPLSSSGSRWSGPTFLCELFLFLGLIHYIRVDAHGIDAPPALMMLLVSHPAMVSRSMSDPPFALDVRCPTHPLGLLRDARVLLSLLWW